MKLRDLLPEAATDARLGSIEVAGVTADSRKVKPGFLFVAIAGAKADGAHFAKQAAAANSAANPVNAPANATGLLMIGDDDRISLVNASMAPTPNDAVPSRNSTSNNRLNPTNAPAPSISAATGLST